MNIFEFIFCPITFLGKLVRKVITFILRVPEDSKKHPRRITSLLYFILFALAMFAVSIAYFINFFHNYVSTRSFSTLAVTASLLFSISTFLLMLSVYVDLKHIEESPEKVSGDYPNWINKKSEWWIRFWIMSFLLLGVGKFSDVFKHMKELTTQHIAAQGGAQVESGSLVGHFFSFLFSLEITSDMILTYSSCTVLVLLILWNVGALLGRFNSKRNCTLNLQDPESLKCHIDYLLVNIRIFLFIFTYLFAAVYWAFNSFWQEGSLTVALLLLALYMIAILSGVGMRYDFLYQRAFKFLGKIVYRRQDIDSLLNL